MYLAETRPGEVREAGRKPCRFGGAPVGRACPVASSAGGVMTVEPVPARPLGHPHHRVGEQKPVLGFEPGVDQWIDCLGDGLFDPAQRRSELVVVGCVPAVEEAEGALVGKHQLEVRRKAHLDLLARAVGCLGGAGDGGDDLEGEHVHEFEIEGTFRREVLVDERLGHPCRLGDFVHRGRGVTVLGEERQGHVEQLAPPSLRGQAAGRRFGGSPPGMARRTGRSDGGVHGSQW